MLRKARAAGRRQIADRGPGVD